MPKCGSSASGRTLHVIHTLKSGSTPESQHFLLQSLRRCSVVILTLRVFMMMITVTGIMRMEVKVTVTSPYLSRTSLPVAA